MVSRATHLSIERATAMGLGPEDMLPSPTKAYLTISQVSFLCLKIFVRFQADRSRLLMRKRLL